MNILNVKENRSSKCSQCNFPDARPRQLLTAEFCPMAAYAKNKLQATSCLMSLFSWTCCFVSSDLVGSPNCLLSS